jgi:hypothetical protein
MHLDRQRNTRATFRRRSNITSNFEHKENSGSVWVNDRKTEDRHPDRTGSATIDGVEYWVSGWLKKTKDDKPYLSLAFKPKNADTAQSKKPAGGGAARPRDFDDSVGF